MIEEIALAYKEIVIPLQPKLKLVIANTDKIPHEVTIIGEAKFINLLCNLKKKNLNKEFIISKKATII
jgi:hypothetical protein